jgi:hypothetical protein
LARLGELQAATDSRLALIGVMEGGHQEEAALHQRFDCLRGEWFEPTRKLLAYIYNNAVTQEHIAASLP